MADAARDSLIVDRMADAVVQADREGVIERWNAAAEALFGFTAAEAVGRSLDLIIPPPLRAAHWRGYASAMNNAAIRLGPGAILTRALRRDGGPIHVEMSFAVLVDADGAVRGSVAVARDATARRQELQALREQLRVARGAGGPD